MESKVKDIDQQSRERIVRELETNFFVEASAGSGKTTSLVYRMVALIEKGVSVDKICTITFTKAAADEFFSRFQALLSIRSINEPDENDKYVGSKTEDSVKRCQEALKNIDSCFMGTIDAFCNMIAHELPSELGIPSDSEVVEMDEHLKIVREVYLLILKDETLPLHNKALRFKELIYPDVDGLCYGVKSFLEMRHTNIVYEKSLKDIDVDGYFDSDKKWLLEVIKNLIDLDDCYNPKKDGSRNDKYKYQTNLKGYYRSLKNKKWTDCLTTLKFALDAILKMDGFNTNALGTDVEQYLNIPEKISKSTSLKYTDFFKEDITTIKDKLSEYKYYIYCDFISEISKLMGEKFKDLGKFQFYDFLYYLNEAFKESANTNKELINHILERHSHFLLDESQDTNPLQTEMFFHLTGTVNDPDWKNVKPKEGSLFIVGDPKQSIYSFRDANVSAYLDNKKIFEKQDEVLILTKNFRSNVRLRNWFNKAMDDLLNHGDEALNHSIIPVEQNEDNVPKDVIDGVYKYHIDEKDDGEYIAQLILSLVGKQKIYSKNEEGKDPRKKERLIRYSDFMIVPRSTTVPKIVDALYRYHIPLTIEANIPFKTSKCLIAVKDLTLLLKAPYDIDKFLKVIHGDLYKLTEKDVINLKNNGFDLNISHEIDIEDNRLDKIIKELHALYVNTYNMGFSSTMLYLLNNKELNILNKVPSSNLEYTLFLIQKIKEKEEDGSLSTVTQLDAFVNNFLESGDDQRSLRFKDKLDRVKLSNVHKVKGLQAPIVLLVKPAQENKTPTKYVDFSYLPPKTYFSKFSEKGDNFRDVVYAETKQFDSMLPRWKNSAQAEKERLEYVAATRAESVLVVGSGKIDSDESSPWAELYGRIDDKCNNGNLKVEDLEPQELTPENITLGDFSINKDSHETSHKYISPSQMRVRKKNDNIDEIDDSMFEKEEKEDATLLGTLVHRLMELLVSSKNTYSVESLITKISNEYYLEEKNKELLGKIAIKIKNGGFEQKNFTLPNDILNTLMSAKHVWCEVPFSYLSQNSNIVSGVIDVMYLDQNDKYHIIDYKTNIEDDVSILEEEYKEQLTNYIYALKKMGVDADAHIYHIKLD